MGKQGKSAWKGLSAVLSTALVLAACGDSGAAPNTNNTSNTGSPEEKPASSYEVVMTYPSFGDVSDVQSVQEAISQITAEKVGATVKLVPVNGSNYANQMNLMLSGSEKLDLVYTSVWFGFDSQVNRGQLLPMDKLLADAGQGILDTVPKEAAEAGKLNGETYGIPSMKAWALTPSLVMSKALIDKHGIDTSALHTWSDAAAVLQVIKDKEPGVAPMVSYTAQETPGTAMLSFDPLGTAPGVLNFEGSDYSLANMYATDEFNQTATLLKNWYDQGYFNKDIATTQETGSSLIKAGKAFSFVRNINDCYSESVAAGVDLVCVPLESSYMTRNSVASNMMSLARNSGNPEKAIEVLELLYTDEAIINLFTNGIEGKHYVKQSSGLIAKPAGVDKTGYDPNQTIVGNNFLSYVWEGTDPDIWKKLQELNDKSVKSRAMGFSFDINPVKTQVAAVTNVQNQYSGGFMTGTTDPADIPAFLTKLEKAGMDKIVAEKQKQLDAWIATK